MATRLYMSNDTFSTVSFSSLGTWGNTVGDHVKQFMYSSNPGDMSFILESYGGGGSGTHKFRTFVSEALDSGIVLDGASFTAVYRIGQSSGSANTLARLTVGIIDSSGNVEWAWTESDSTEVTTSTTTPSSRTNTVSPDSGALVYTTSANDRLVFEIGWWQQSSGSYTQVVSRGNTSGTDLSSTDGDTDIQNPWFESSVTLTFGGAEPPPPATNEDYNCSVYIAGVCDEWV